MFLHLEFEQLWNQTHSLKANTKISLIFHVKFYQPEFIVMWGFLGEEVPSHH